MTLPTGFGSQLFKPLKPSEMDFLQEYYDRNEDYQQEWVERLYGGSLRNLPLLHLTYLVCEISRDKLPGVNWWATPRMQKLDRLEDDIYDVEGYRKQGSEFQRICNKLKRAIGSSWASDLKAARKQIAKDLLTLHTEESIFKFTDQPSNRDRQMDIDMLNILNPIQYARFKAWESLALEGSPEYKDEDDHLKAVNELTKKYRKIQDPEEIVPKSIIEAIQRRKARYSEE